MVETYASWLIAGALLLLLAVVLGAVVIKRGLAGILLDERGRFSLTHFQLVMWTVVVLSLMFGTFWGRVRYGVAGALNFSIPSQVLLLLGISVGSTTLASTIKTIKDTSLPTQIAASDANDQPRLAQMFLVEEGDQADKVIDITKFQNFWITVILGVAYVVLAVAAIHQAKTPDKLTALPGLSSQFVTLLAISHAGYIVGKVPNRPGVPDGLTVQRRHDAFAPSDAVGPNTYRPRNPKP